MLFFWQKYAIILSNKIIFWKNCVTFHIDISSYMWRRITENELLSLKQFQEAYDRDADVVTDETTLLYGIENVYYVDPENVKEAFQLWNYENEPEKAQRKAEEAATGAAISDCL